MVLYEEALNELVIEAAVRAIRKADTLIVGGTSLAVYPATGLLDYFRGDKVAASSAPLSSFFIAPTRASPSSKMPLGLA